MDVPAASVAIILSGTGSAREYIQRLGRILRKGKDSNKLARLYEVVAEDTSEEGTSQRRRGVERREPRKNEPHQRSEAGGVRREGAGEERYRQLEIVKPTPVYGVGNVSQRAAESLVNWGESSPDEDLEGPPESRLNRLLAKKLLCVLLHLRLTANAFASLMREAYYVQSV